VDAFRVLVDQTLSPQRKPRETSVASIAASSRPVELQQILPTTELLLRQSAGIYKSLRLGNSKSDVDGMSVLKVHPGFPNRS
jgi:hypothetical protein